MNKISLEELNKLPYVKNQPTSGQVVILRSFYDHQNDDWILFMEAEPGRLGRIKGGEVVSGSYFSERPATPEKDLIFPLGTFITQYLSFPNVAGPLSALESDFHNFSAILEKYQLITQQPREKRGGISQLLSVELEHLVIVIRSVYDLIQKLSKHATALIKSIDEPRRTIVENLPDSFARVTLDGSRLRSEEELIERYRLPPPLARFYVDESMHFQAFRDLRVAIEHYGRSLDRVYDLDEGMAIAVDEDPWRSLPIWRPELIRNERLGSLRAVFAYLIFHAIEMTTNYARAYASCVAVPPAIGPGYNLYFRDYFSHHLVNLPETLEYPWERQ